MSEFEGLFGKYIITKADGTEIGPDAKYFVLRYDKDFAAWMALRSYALHTPNKELQKDLLEESRKYQGENKLQRFDWLQEVDRLISENASLTQQLAAERQTNHEAVAYTERLLEQVKRQTHRLIDKDKQIKRLSLSLSRLNGVSCNHPGCLNHLSHPCEVCGRIGGKYQPLTDRLEGL